MFENLLDAKQQLLKDKHALLEGYVTEYLFEKQFLRSQNGKYFSGYTNGWWSAGIGEHRFFFLVAPSLNNIDRRVIQSLAPQYEVWRAWPEKENWHFYKGNLDLELKSFLHRFKLSPFRSGGKATATTRDIERQSKCLDFFTIILFS